MSESELMKIKRLLNEAIGTLENIREYTACDYARVSADKLLEQIEEELRD